MTTWTQVRNETLAFFEDNWDFDEMPVQYHNNDMIKKGSKSSPLNLNDDKLKSFVRLSLEPVRTSQFEFSSGINTRTNAYMIVTALNRKNSGTLFFAQVYDKVQDLFLNKNIGDARFTDMDVSSQIYSDNFVHQTITLNITFENIQ